MEKKCIKESQLQCERWREFDQDPASRVAPQRNSFELLWTIVSSPQPLLRLHFPSHSRLGNANPPLHKPTRCSPENEKLKFGLMAFIMAENIHITITNEIICNNNLITQNESFVLMQLYVRHWICNNWKRGLYGTLCWNISWQSKFLVWSRSEWMPKI